MSLKISENDFIHAIQAKWADRDMLSDDKDHLSNLFKRCVDEDVEYSASRGVLGIRSPRIIKELENKTFTVFQKAFALLNLVYSLEEEIHTLNKLSLEEKEKNEIKDLVLSTHLYSFKKPGIESAPLSRLAVILAEKDPRALVRFLDKFVEAGLDHTELSKLTAILVKQHPYILARFIDKFVEAGLDRTELFKLAAVLIEKNSTILEINFDKFIKTIDPKKLSDFAAFIAEKNLRIFLKHISQFVEAGLDRTELSKIITKIVKINPATFAATFAMYLNKLFDAGFDPAEILKLVTTIAEKNPYILEWNIDKFIKAFDPKKLPELADIIAKKDPDTLVQNIGLFIKAGLAPAELPKLAAIIAEKDPDTLARHIGLFIREGLEPTELPNLVAKIAEKNLDVLAWNIDRFVNAGFDPLELPKLAAMIAKKYPQLLALNIYKFFKPGFHSAKLHEITMRIAKRKPSALVGCLDNFIKAGLDPAEIPKLVKIIIKKDLKVLAKGIDKFVNAGLDPLELPKLAAIIAEKNPGTLIKNIHKFIKAGINSEKLYEFISTYNLIGLLLNHLDGFISIAGSFAVSGLDQEKRDAFLNQKNSLGLTALQICLMPPVIYSLGSIINLIPSNHKTPPSFESLKKLYQKDPSIGDVVFQRVMERYPYYLQEDADLEGLEAFYQAIDSLKIPTPVIVDLFAWDFKMNQSLPLTKECLQRVEKLIISANEDENSILIQIRLALQTHEDLSEIELAINKGHITESFPLKQAFFALSLEEQRNFMCRAQVFRERDALFAANRIIKMAVEQNIYDPNLLEYSIKLLSKTGIEGSSQTIQRLSKLLQRELSSELKVYATHALSQVEVDPTHSGRKSMLMRLLSEVDSSDEALQIALIDCLGTYQFSGDEEIHSLFALAKNSKNPRVLRSLAFTLSGIPKESALKRAVAIVESDAWAEIERKIQKADLIGKAGGYELYTYRPSFHDSRNVMRRVIAERLVEINRQKLREKIEARYQKYRGNPENYPNIEMLEKNIRGIEDEIRYIPFQLFFPKGRVFFRGLNMKKGEKLGEASFYDLLMKGAGSADLRLYDSYRNGTWAKAGQMFTSSTREYVERGYFDQDGVLMTIPSDAINEMQLRRNIRFQSEYSIHAVFYPKIQHHMISQIFISKVRKADVQKISTISLKQKRIEKRSREERKYKVMRRQLERVSSEAKSLKDRIVYFDPNSDNLTSELDRIMKEQGLSEATQDEIVKENIERLIARQLLAQTLSDPQLRSCLKFASQISPLQFVRQP